MKPNSDTAPRLNRTICMHFCQVEYEIIVQSPEKFREKVLKIHTKHPELFPHDINLGFKMKEIRLSKKLNLKIRRIIISGISYSIRPSFAMPYMTGLVQDVEKPLFLRKFAVPFWALSYCYGKDAMYWYRLETSLGRNSIVGTTIKSTNKLSTHIATTAANNCILGACVSESASEKQLTKAYGIFKEEVESVIPAYKPETVNTDGWLPTQNSWKTLFPQITLIACFLHIYIGIRDRSKKKYKEVFNAVATKLWDCYKTESKSSFFQRVRRLSKWCSKTEAPDIILEKIKKLREKLPQLTKAYDFSGSHRTSNMIDRLMQRMDRHLFSTQYFHGTLESANLSIRSWALIQNFAPFNPWTVKQKCHKSSFEGVNGFQYHDNWLQNLLIAASL